MSIEEVLPGTANFLRHVLWALKFFNKPEERLRQFMPQPLKTEESLRRACALATTDVELSCENLLSEFINLAVLEKKHSKCLVLQQFLRERHTIARYFLSVPILTTLASTASTAWKKRKGYKDDQSWLYLEYSQQRVQDWIRERLPRACDCRPTSHVARLMDDIDRMAPDMYNKMFWSYNSGTLQDLKNAGLWNEEWVSDDPLALVALELIESKRFIDSEPSMPGIPELDEDLFPDSLWSGECLKPFEPLRQRHESLQFASIRLIGLKLVESYANPPFDYSYDEERRLALQPFQTRFRLRSIQDYIEDSMASEETSTGHPASRSYYPGHLTEHIEDLLEDARALLDAGQVCACCASCFKAIVECSSLYAYQLAKPRLSHLAKCVLLHWKKPDLDKLWIDTDQPPFPAPILDEIERCRWYSMEPDRATLTESLPSLEYIVTQYQKAKNQGLVRKYDEYEDLVMKTAVQVLDMAQAQLQQELLLIKEVVEDMKADACTSNHGDEEKITIPRKAKMLGKVKDGVKKIQRQANHGNGKEKITKPLKTRRFGNDVKKIQQGDDNGKEKITKPLKAKMLAMVKNLVFYR